MPLRRYAHAVAAPSASRTDSSCGESIVARGYNSHSAAAFVELVALDDRLDVFPRAWKINMAKKVLLRNGGSLISSGPSLRTARPGIVLSERESERFRLNLPMVEGAAQIPGAGFQIRLWVEKLLVMEIVDPVFTSPFVGRFLAHLHEPALTRRPIFLRIEATLAPYHRLHEH